MFCLFSASILAGVPGLGSGSTPLGGRADADKALALPVPKAKSGMLGAGLDSCSSWRVDIEMSIDRKGTLTFFVLRCSHMSRR